MTHVPGRLAADSDKLAEELCRQRHSERWQQKTMIELAADARRAKSYITVEEYINHTQIPVPMKPCEECVRQSRRQAIFGS
ncbi:MAG: hypothetical protein WC757_00940 [Candidatus Paceibacterota bacterium]|jgi:hypothetical protein